MKMAKGRHDFPLSNKCALHEDSLKKELENKTYMLPKAALDSLDQLQILLNGFGKALSEKEQAGYDEIVSEKNGPSGMSDEMVKQRTKEHEQQSIHSPDH